MWLNTLSKSWSLVALYQKDVKRTEHITQRKPHKSFSCYVTISIWENTLSSIKTACKNAWWMVIVVKKKKKKNNTINPLVFNFLHSQHHEKAFLVQRFVILHPCMLTGPEVAVLPTFLVVTFHRNREDRQTYQQLLFSWAFLGRNMCVFLRCSYH